MKKIAGFTFLYFTIFFFPINGNSQNNFSGAIPNTENQKFSLHTPPIAEKNYIIGNKRTATSGFNEKEWNSFWQSELDSLGVIHNNALDYAFQRMRSMNLSNLSSSTMPDLVATLTSEFFTNRYGSIYNFSQEDLKNEILSIGLTPMPPTSQNVSDELRETINSITISLSGLRETESSRDFASTVTAITSGSLPNLSVNEQMYLRGYADVITQSLDYWDNNGNAWVDLFNSSSSVEKEQRPEIFKTTRNGTESSFEENTILPNNLMSSNIYSYVYGNNDLIGDIPQRHPCATAIASADGGGLFAGLIRGCIVGALFGAGVGCIPAAIFWGGVQGVSQSLGAGIVCLAMR